jgi:hypothetical protein
MVFTLVRRTASFTLASAFASAAGVVFSVHLVVDLFDTLGRQSHRLGQLLAGLLGHLAGQSRSFPRDVNGDRKLFVAILMT